MGVGVYGIGIICVVQANRYIAIAIKSPCLMAQVYGVSLVSPKCSVLGVCAARGPGRASRCQYIPLVPIILAVNESQIQ